MENKIAPRISILTTSYPRWEGDESGIFIQRLVEAYNDLGINGQIIVPKDTLDSATQELGNFKILRFKYGIFTPGRLAFGSGIIPNLKANPFLLLQAPALIIGMAAKALKHKAETDLIHAQWSGALLAAWLCWLSAKIPYIATVRGEEARLLKKPALAWIFKAALKSAKAITTVNQEFCLQIKDYLGTCATPVVCIPNGVATPVCTEELLAQVKSKYKLTNKKYLCFIGSVIPRKQVEVLITALNTIELKDYTILICGRLNHQKYFDKLKELALKLGLQERTHFLGAIEPLEVGAILELSEFYLTASSFEGRPNSVLEALAFGKVVLASDIPAHREIIQHKVNGLLFDPNKLEEIGSLIKSAAEDGAALSNKARESVKELSWEKAARGYLKLAE